VSGVAGVGAHENVELGVRNEVNPPQIRALEAPFEGKMSLLGFPLKTKQELHRERKTDPFCIVKLPTARQDKIRQNVYLKALIESVFHLSAA
jgi:hypothetical protein